jgi:hypothetical protein
MRKASTELLEQGIQAPSPAPDLIPAEPIINRGLTLGLVQQTGALQINQVQNDDAECAKLVELETSPAQSMLF